ncbi:hypothetical protein [Streptomyces mirabilis]|uniref:hypothetical protein n=1 Tax=Streptomyces mirabilis TaxID=68239 RepID=UPI0033A26AB8
MLAENITRGMNEVAVADIGPDDLADPAVEGHQINSRGSITAQSMRRLLILAVGQADLVGAWRETVFALELLCHLVKHTCDQARPRGQPGRRQRTLTHGVGSCHELQLFVPTEELHPA